MYEKKGVFVGRVATILLGFLWGLQYSFLAKAGAWPISVGHGQVIQTNLIVNAQKGFDSSGELSLPVQFSKYEAGVFWEHGLSEKLTLVLASSFQDIKFVAGVDEVDFSGFGETEISVRRVMWRNTNSIVSAQIGVVFAGAGETVSDADLGIGGTQYQMRLLAGRSFKFAGRDGFVEGQFAWRFRSQNIPDEWSLDLTTGWRPHPKWQILAQSFYVDGQAELGLARSTSRLKLQTALVYDQNHKTSYQIGVYKTVAGKNIIQEKAVFLSIWQRY